MKAPAVVSGPLLKLSQIGIALTLAFCQVSGQERLAGGVILGTATDSSLRPVIPAGDTLRLAFTMETSPVALPGVVVTERGISSRLRDFEERRRNGAGQFFNQAEIEARNVVSTTDLLRQVKGLALVTTDRLVFATSGRQWSLCPMQIYVDGLGMSSHTGPFDLNQLPSPKETMAIEVYSGPASVPLWLPPGPTNGKPQCGVVLIWTRDGSGP